MKHFYLIIASLVCVMPIFAQSSSGYNPKIFFFSKAAGPMDDTVSQRIVELFDVSHRRGFQQTHKPNFIVSGGEGFSLTIGGFVNFRTAYDFDGTVNNLDMITYDIPIPGSYKDRQQLQMDAFTSRLYFKAISNSKTLGPIISYIGVDFRGNNNNPRLRSAYIYTKGFLFGRDITTFCDLQASPTTIDFQGPNAYTFNFNQMVRYRHSFRDNRWVMGVAIEMPQISATTTANLQTIPQRVPDIPVYLQYNWDQNRSSHLRLSGLVRTLTYQNIEQDKTRNATGWAVQLSNTTRITPKLSFNGQVVYGEGITPYVQDLNNSKLDLAPNPNNSGTMIPIPVMGWFSSLQYNIAENLFVSGGYSQVRVYQKNGYYTNDEYRLSKYCFGNIFWNVTEAFEVGVEYLYGTRQNMNLEKNHANRIQAMIQYNF